MGPVLHNEFLMIFVSDMAGGSPLGSPVSSRRTDGVANGLQMDPVLREQAFQQQMLQVRAAPAFALQQQMLQVRASQIHFYRSTH